MNSNFHYQIHHVNIIVKNREKSLKQLKDILNVVPSLSFSLGEAEFRGKKTKCEAKLDFVDVGPVKLELIEPGKGDSAWSEYLNNEGEGVQHLGIYVPDLESELARLGKLGIKVIQRGEDETVKFAYVDTKKNIGVVLEFLESKQK